MPPSTNATEQQAVVCERTGDSSDTKEAQQSRPWPPWPQEVRAFHEGGHATCHHHFGHKIVEVKADSDAEACCRLAGGQEVETLDYIIACCAGKAAVDKVYGYKAKSDDNWRASKDRRDAFAAALHLSHNDIEAAELLMWWAERMAEVLVEQQWSQVHKVAFGLLEFDRLTGDQVKQLIESHNGKDAWNDRRTTTKDKNV